MSDAANKFEFLAAQMAEHETSWSLGTFGAIAEFMRDADEPAHIVKEDQSTSVVTPRGGIRLEASPGLRPMAFETVCILGPPSGSFRNIYSILDENGIFEPLVEFLEDAVVLEKHRPRACPIAATLPRVRAPRLVRR